MAVLLVYVMDEMVIIVADNGLKILVALEAKDKNFLVVAMEKEFLLVESEKLSLVG